MKPDKLFPPGYGYREELKGTFVLLAWGMVMNINFFGRLYQANARLYQHVVKYEKDRVIRIDSLRQGVIVDSFLELAEGYWWWYLPWLIYLAVTVVQHYTYYYRGAKSIYVMRRIKTSGVIQKSCMNGTLFQWAMGTAIIIVWYLLFLAIYMLVIPQVCNPRFV